MLSKASQTDGILIVPKKTKTLGLQTVTEKMGEKAVEGNDTLFTHQNYVNQPSQRLLDRPPSSSEGTILEQPNTLNRTSDILVASSKQNLTKHRNDVGV